MREVLVCYDAEFAPDLTEVVQRRASRVKR